MSHCSDWEPADNLITSKIKKKNILPFFLFLLLLSTYAFSKPLGDLCGVHMSARKGSRRGALDSLGICYGHRNRKTQEQKDFLRDSTWNPGLRSLEAQELLKAEMRGTSLLVQCLRH